MIYLSLKCEICSQLTVLLDGSIKLIGTISRKRFERLNEEYHVDTLFPSKV